MRENKLKVFSNIVTEIASLSGCERLQVGALIIDEYFNIISFGYNGNYSSGPNGCDSKEIGNCFCTHAEMNALIKLKGYENNLIMILTDSPCIICTKLIINSHRISTIYFKNEYRLTEGLELLKNVGISVIKL